MAKKKPIVPLTAQQVIKYKNKDKTYTVADGAGLYLVVNPTSKKWRYRFRLNGIPKTMSLGTYPDVSLSQARDRLLVARNQVASGVDPVNDGKRIKPDTLTFSEVATNYLEHNQEDFSSHHTTRTESILKHHINPFIGKKSMPEITIAEINDIMNRLVKMDKVPTAKKALSILKGVYGYAKSHNHVLINLAYDIQAKHYKKHTAKPMAALVEREDIARLMIAIDGYSGVVVKKALLFTAYTALRTYPVRAMKWSYCDFKAELITIPPELMKNRKEFTIPMTRQIKELLHFMQDVTGAGVYIFPNGRGDRPMSENAMLSAIRYMGFTKEEFTPHGFRAMFSTVANEDSDFTPRMIDYQLSHNVTTAIEGKYNRATYIQQRKDLLQWWSDYLSEVLDD